MPDLCSDSPLKMFTKMLDYGSKSLKNTQKTSKIVAFEVLRISYKNIF